MKKVIYYSLGIMTFVCYSFNWAGNINPSAEKAWQVIHTESIGPITFSLQLKEAPSMADSNWINIQLLNETGEALQVSNVLCNVSLSGMNEKGKILTEGFFESADANDIFNLPSSPNPFEETKLPQGLSEESNRISTLCTSILGFSKEPLKIRGTLEFFLELQGKHRYFIAPEKIEFAFDWKPLSDFDKKNILVTCQDKLQKPSNSTFEVHRLVDLLSVPGIAKSLTADELITGLSLRRDFSEGRQAIATVLAKTYASDKLVKGYYQDHINGQDYRVLEDLKLQPKLWSKEYITPMISWLEAANNSTKYRILETLYQHRADWENKKEIVQQLSQVIESNFGNLIKSSPSKLDQRALVSWAAAAHMWSLTTNKGAINYMIPFLKNKKAVIGSELLLDHNSYSMPRPTRVCDVAIEAILRLEGKDLEKTYFQAGFKPPYLYGEAPIVIKKIRTDLITEWQRKNRIVQP